MRLSRVFYVLTYVDNNNNNNEKRSEETQTLRMRAGCSKAEPNVFAPPQTPFPGTREGQNLIYLQTQFGEDRCTQFRVIVVTDPKTQPQTHTQLVLTLVVPRTHNKFGDRSFSAASPRVWNDLPSGLRQPGLSFATFRRQLKTFLFSDRSK